MGRRRIRRGGLIACACCGAMVAPRGLSPVPGSRYGRRHPRICTRCAGMTDAEHRLAYYRETPPYSMLWPWTPDELAALLEIPAGELRARAAELLAAAYPG